MTLPETPLGKSKVPVSCPRLIAPERFEVNMPFSTILYVSMMYLRARFEEERKVEVELERRGAGKTKDANVEKGRRGVVQKAR